MNTRILVLVAAICGVCLFVIPQPASFEAEQTMAIDFDALHAQASAALINLQHTDTRQLVLKTVAEF